ncbi:MAG TPA: DedA family protein [Stellaceae bacterium]|jgi:membrane protein DedA with SNARE-associated domain|nr:DedA family protein [Stellaceae bacterium]
MDINQLIANNGACFYAIVFVWTFLEGETVVLFAAFAAAQGLVNPVLLLVAAWLGSFAGDQSYFWLGRHFGVRLLERFPRWRHGVDTALRWLERYDAGFILTFRFIYGVRNFSSFALGLSAVRWNRFLLLNFAAAGLWALLFVSVGYFLGHAFRAVLGDLARSFSLVMLGIFVLIGGGMWLLHRRHRRRRVQVPRGGDVVLPPS